MNKMQLPPIVDRMASSVLQSEINDVLTADVRVTLDGSKVERIGQTGLQLLVSAALTARNRGGSIAISDPSEPLMAAAGHAGLADWLEANT